MAQEDNPGALACATGAHDPFLVVCVSIIAALPSWQCAVGPCYERENNVFRAY